MVDDFDNGTLCTWEKSQHFVCSAARKVFSTAIEYGAFGMKNFFALYFALPWCFIIGLIVGISFALVQG